MISCFWYFFWVQHFSRSMMPNWRLALLMGRCAKIGFWKVMRARPPHPQWKLQPWTSIKASETATRPSPLLHLLIWVYLFITCRHSLTPTAANINDVGIMRTKHFIVLPPYPHPPDPLFHLYSFMPLPPKMHINTNGDKVQKGARESETVTRSGWWDGGEGDSDWLGERSRESEEENGGNEGWMQGGGEEERSTWH